MNVRNNSVVVKYIQKDLENFEKCNVVIKKSIGKTILTEIFANKTLFFSKSILKSLNKYSKIFLL